MKKKIHPQYYNCEVNCSCGNVFKVGATKPKIQVEICSACHPFYTGKKKIIDSQGRVQKFKAKVEKAKKMKAMPRHKKRLSRKKNKSK